MHYYGIIPVFAHPPLGSEAAALNIHRQMFNDYGRPLLNFSWN